MKKKYSIIVAILVLIASVAYSFPAIALNNPACDKVDGAKFAGSGCESKIPTAPSVITTVLNVVIGIVGVISVIFIIIGGYMYATSAGDPGKTKKAKDTILYSVIGLAVALLSFAIVNFVLSNIIN